MTCRRFLAAHEIASDVTICTGRVCAALVVPDVMPDIVSAGGSERLLIGLRGGRAFLESGGVLNWH